MSRDTIIAQQQLPPLGRRPDTSVPSWATAQERLLSLAARIDREGTSAERLAALRVMQANVQRQIDEGRATTPQGWSRESAEASRPERPARPAPAAIDTSYGALLTALGGAASDVATGHSMSPEDLIAKFAAAPTQLREGRDPQMAQLRRMGMLYDEVMGSLPQGSPEAAALAEQRGAIQRAVQRRWWDTLTPEAAGTLALDPFSDRRAPTPTGWYTSSGDFGDTGEAEAAARVAAWRAAQAAGFDQVQQWISSYSRGG